MVRTYRGLNRLHQFDKVEIVRIDKPEHSYQSLDEMLDHVEGLLKKLELPITSSVFAVETLASQLLSAMTLRCGVLHKSVGWRYQACQTSKAIRQIVCTVVTVMPMIRRLNSAIH